MSLTNYQDVSRVGASVDAGFQFDFYCANCSRRWKSPFTPYRRGQFSGLIYKLAYKDSLRDYSVGSILSLEMFRQAIDEDRVEEIDYGVGSEPYKRDWMEDRRRLYGLVAFNLRTPSGLVRAGFEKAKLALRCLPLRRGAKDEGDVTPMSAS